MKKNVSIEKKLSFSSMIGEVTAISLENDLKFISNEEVEGNLIVSGRYKSTLASQIEEEFNEKIPVSITLLEKVDISTAKIDIVDFYYEVEDEELLRCNVELLVDALEIIDDDDSNRCDINNESLDKFKFVNEDKSGCSILVDDERECDGDAISEKEIEIPRIENADCNEEKKDIENEMERVDENIVNNKQMEEAVEVKEVEDNVEEVNIEENENENLFFNFDSSKETYGTFVVYMVRQNETINTILEKYKTTIEEVEKYNDIKDISIGSKLIIPLLNEKD